MIRESAEALFDLDLPQCTYADEIHRKRIRQSDQIHQMQAKTSSEPCEQAQANNKKHHANPLYVEACICRRWAHSDFFSPLSKASE
jgi:hypothetical protein